MSNALKLGSPLKLYTSATDPSGPEDGLLYYNSDDFLAKIYANGDWEQLATKSYVNATAAGLDPKESVRIATTADIADLGDVDTASAAIFDGLPNSMVLAVDDRILVRSQSNAQQNGIYRVSVAGGSGTLVRAPDHDGTPSNEVSSGNFVFVENGTLYAATGWVLQGDGILTLGAADLNWVQFSAVVSTLQAAYDGGPTITTSSAVPVEIIAGGIGASALKLHTSMLSQYHIKLSNPGSELRIRANPSGSNYDLTLPGSQAAMGQFLKDPNGDGSLAWGGLDTNVTGVNGTVNSILFIDGSNLLQESASLTWDGSAFSVGSSILFTVASSDGNIGYIRGVDYLWPTADAAGSLQSDGGGNLSWAAIDLADVTGILPIANGGTNSSTALANNRIMVSSGSAIVEHSYAPLEGEVIFADGDGLPFSDADFFYDAGAQRLGLGTGAPGAKLHVVGGFMLESNATTRVLERMSGDTLPDNTNVAATVSGLNYAAATYKGCIISYSIRDATTGDTRVGTLTVANESDGSALSIADTFAETADVGVTWTVVFNTPNVEIQYTTTSTGNDRTLVARQELIT